MYPFCGRCDRLASSRPQLRCHLAALPGAQNARTLIWFSKGPQLMALTGAADQLQPTAKEANAQLKKMGIEPHLVTGDNA